MRTARMAMRTPRMAMPTPRTAMPTARTMVTLTVQRTDTLMATKDTIIRAHGDNGGHLVDLEGGAHAEWTHDDQKNVITVFVDELEAVSAVEMRVTIEGNTTPYKFEKTDLEGKSVYQLESPELLTAAKMGQGVDTKLVITTEEGEVSGQVKHHAH